MKKKYERKNKKMISVYVDSEWYRGLAERASFRGITISAYVVQAITELMIKENKFI